MEGGIDMSECPFCGTVMEPGTLAGAQYEGCPACGGVWIAAEALGKLVKEHPERLADMDDNWPDRGGRPSLDRVGVICPESGDELVPKSFPIFPQQPILASPKAKKLFFRSGELRTLHGHVSPGTLPPPPRPVAPLDEHVERRQRMEEAQREQDAAAMAAALGMRWPERADGQSWPSWFVCGMPIWFGAVLLLFPALLMMVVLHQVNAQLASSTPSLADAADEDLPPGAAEEGYSEADVSAGEVQIQPILALPIVYLAWPLTTLGLTLVLLLVYTLGGEGGPPMGFGLLFLLLLKVTAVVLTVDSVISVVQFMQASYLVVFVLSAISRLIIYRSVLELEWRECYLLSVIGSFCPLSAL